MKENLTIKRLIWVDPGRYKELKTIAAYKDITISDLIDDHLDAIINHEKKKIKNSLIVD